MKPSIYHDDITQWCVSTRQASSDAIGAVPAWPGRVPPRIGRAVAPQPPFPHFLRTLAAWRCGRPRFMMMFHDMYANVHVEKCGR